MSTKQAAAETPVLMTDEDFENHGEVSVYWLTSASVLINSHGTTILMDPVITPTSEDPLISEAMDDDQTGYMPLLVRSPIYAPDIHKLTAVLITHADVDHMGFLSIRALQKLGVAFHGTPYVGKALEELGVPGEQITTHLVGETFQIEDVTVEVTDALHPWQKYFPQVYDYVYQPGDCCGYKCTCGGGVVIWNPGDSEPLDSHFTHTDADLVFMDYSEDAMACHMGRDAAVRLSNHLIDSELVMYHWGTFDQPAVGWCNADPQQIRPLISRPERFHALRPGEKFIVHKNSKKG